MLMLIDYKSLKIVKEKTKMNKGGWKMQKL